MHVSLADLVEAVATFTDADHRTIVREAIRTAVKADGLRRLARRMEDAERIIRGTGGRFDGPTARPIPVDRNGKIDA